MSPIKRTGQAILENAIFVIKLPKELFLTIFSTMQKAGVPFLACLPVTPVLAAKPDGLVTGSFKA